MTLPTEKMYWSDPLLAGFRARVIGHGVWQGAPSVILDRTAFYAEAGGQMADRGVLGELAVTDVQIDDAGLIHHLVGTVLPAVGDEIDGRVDLVRRRIHMAQHTGQHMLSRALLDEAGGETVSSRLGESACTIDIDLAKVDEAKVARAEDLVNSVVDDDAAVRVFFPEPAELATLPLRRDPKVADNVRIVAIGGFDMSPCGGTHCVRTAQVGLVRVTGLERYKGKMRVSFSAGPRARAGFARHDDVLRAMARDLTCGPTEVPAALAKMRQNLAEAREALGQSRARIADATAVALIAAARRAEITQIVALVDGDVEMARAVAKRITAEPGLVALLGASGPEGIHVLAARGPGSTFDCGAFMKKLAAAGGGRGGGGPERAEGKLPAGAAFSGLVAASLLQ